MPAIFKCKPRDLAEQLIDTRFPFWQTTDNSTVRLYLGNVTEVLKDLPEKSVQTVVTSPPYWGLRSYATGDAKHLEIGAEPSPDCGTHGQAQCGRCFVCSMVAVFRGVRRVLRDDGTLWLNLGDTYAGSSTTGGNAGYNSSGGPDGFKQGRQFKSTRRDVIAAGNLVGVPWRVALALQADGWILRQDIIWAKPSPMPESVKNRCTKAHEYVFLLTKGQRYFCDMEAIKEEAPNDKNGSAVGGTKYQNDPGCGAQSGNDYVATGRSNRRSVWRVASEGYGGTHFACFPTKLIEPMILAGTSEKGCCAKCGAPWARMVDRVALKRERPNDYVKRTGEDGTGSSCANSVAGVEVETLGWEPGCECHGTFEKRKIKKLIGSPKATGRKVENNTDGLVESDIRNRDGASWAAWQAADHVDEDYKEVTGLVYVSDLPLDDHPVVPCVVLDPFVGSGTTCCVSLANGRRSIGIDLSEKYLRKNAIPRISGELLDRPKYARLIPKS